MCWEQFAIFKKGDFELKDKKYCRRLQNLKCDDLKEFLKQDTIQVTYEFVMKFKTNLSTCLNDTMEWKMFIKV